MPRPRPTGPTRSRCRPGRHTQLQFSDPNTTYGDGFYASAAAGHFTPDYSLASDVVVGSSEVGGIDITLPLLVHITGIVSGAGSGPLAGIDVFAVPTSLLLRTIRSTTEADGSYSVAVLPGEAYQVQFYDPNLVYGGGFYDSSAGDGYASDGTLATDVVVDSSDVGGIDVTLPLAVHITGTVTGPGGVPLAGIDVAASPTVLGWGGYATTGADGTYSAAVPPGLSYRLSFSDPEGTYANGNYDSTAPGHYVPDTSSGTAVVVGSSDVAGIDIRLPASGAAPGAPTGVTATAGDGSAEVTWTAPADEGDSAITVYTVTSDPDGATCVWTSGPLTCTVSGLTNGTAYTFTVTATNDSGIGLASDPSAPVIPSAPTPTLQSIAVTPANPTIAAGANQQFVATGTYSDASTAVITGSVTWASATPATATDRQHRARPRRRRRHEHHQRDPRAGQRQHRPDGQRTDPAEHRGHPGQPDDRGRADPAVRRHRHLLRRQHRRHHGLGHLGLGHDGHRHDRRHDRARPRRRRRHEQHQRDPRAASAAAPS